MRVEVFYKLHPPSVFGLPGDDYTVIPGGEAGIKDVVGPTIDTLTGSVVGLGTLSQYRRFDERLSLRLEREGVGVQLVDNYVTLTLDIDGRSLDLEKCESLIESLCLWLTHFASTPVFAEPLQAVIPETQQVLPLRTTCTATKFRWYHVPTIEGSVREWSSCNMQERLVAALRYYRLGLLLAETGSSHFDSFQAQLMVEAISNYWKAVSAIVGDPSVDRDYQRRYRQYGIDEAFFKGEIEWLRKDMRNQSGVAHYRLGRSDSAKLLEDCSRAGRIAKTVIAAAIRYDMTGTSR